MYRVERLKIHLSGSVADVK